MRHHTNFMVISKGHLPLHYVPKMCHQWAFTLCQHQVGGSESTAANQQSVLAANNKALWTFNIQGGFQEWLTIVFSGWKPTTLISNKWQSREHCFHILQMKMMRSCPSLKYNHIQSHLQYPMSRNYRINNTFALDLNNCDKAWISCGIISYTLQITWSLCHHNTKIKGSKSSQITVISERNGL